MKEKKTTSKLAYTCQWCGKTFTPASGHAKRFCSDECHRALRRAYNTKYQADKRAKMTDEELEPNRRLSRKTWAKQTWQKWGEEAQKVLKLAQTAHPHEAITKYLCDTYRFRSVNTPAPDMVDLEEARIADETIAKTLNGLAN